MISAYALTALGGERRMVGSALIFAVVNLLGSVLFLIATAGLYRATGTLEMLAIADRARGVDPNTAVVIAVLYFVAFGVKLGLFPFHFWLPSVYGSAPAGGRRRPGRGAGQHRRLRPAALRGRPAAPRARPRRRVLVGLGSASIIYGAVQAVGRRDGREVLAYSAIGHAGYVLVALGVGGPGRAVRGRAVHGGQRARQDAAVPGRRPARAAGRRRLRGRRVQRRRGAALGRLLRQGGAVRRRHPGPAAPPPWSCCSSAAP